MSKDKKNKLSIYLIKEDIPLDEIIVQDRSLKELEVNGAKLCIKPSATKRPAWVKNFFGSFLDEQKNIFSSMPSAVLITHVKMEEDKVRLFAITFGAGYHLLKKGVYEERFGLRVVLNAVDEKNIKRIDKQNFGALVKQMTEQALRNAETSEFGIDIEQDLIQAVTGLSSDITLGKVISGRDSLHVSVPRTIKNINDFLKLCFQYSESKVYKKKFPFIDQIAEIRDVKKIKELDDELISKINSDNHDKLWIAIPEIIDWADFDCFKYRTSTKAKGYRDLHIPDFIKEHEKYKGAFTLQMLKRYEAYCYFENSPEKSWCIYDCMYAEISKGDSIYTLTNGKWYQINHDFSADVEKEYSEILSLAQPVVLPNCPTRYENNTEPVVESQYNEYAAEKSGSALLDLKLIIHSGSPMEICDLYTKNREFIYVKHYGGSSVLSHLFNQGVVSAELFSSHGSFRKEMNKKVPSAFQVKKPELPIIPEEYKVVFGIISNAEGVLQIPFFSKVSLRNSFRRLRLYRYGVYLQKIAVDKSIQLKSDKNKKKEKK